MPVKCVVVKFDPERGYGFVRLPHDGSDAFAHIGDVVGRRALVPGQEVTCDVVDTPKGAAAKNIVPGPVQTSPHLTFAAGAAALASSGAAAFRLGLSIPWIPSILLAINATTFLMYGYDKAVAGGRFLRVPEAILHLLALAGGTPAAWLGQFFFRHKTRKGSFRVRFWVIVLLQITLVGSWIWYESKQAPKQRRSLQLLFPG
jgi:uncharacterized membrane protein YsdA (DUF1294 family)/cold shock CspA family protein